MNGSRATKRQKIEDISEMLKDNAKTRSNNDRRGNTRDNGDIRSIPPNVYMEIISRLPSAQNQGRIRLASKELLSASYISIDTLTLDFDNPAIVSKMISPEEEFNKKGFNIFIRKFKSIKSVNILNISSNNDWCIPSILKRLPYKDRITKVNIHYKKINNAEYTVHVFNRILRHLYELPNLDELSINLATLNKLEIDTLYRVNHVRRLEIIAPKCNFDFRRKPYSQGKVVVRPSRIMEFYMHGESLTGKPDVVYYNMKVLFSPNILEKIEIDCKFSFDTYFLPKDGGIISYPKVTTVIFGSSVQYSALSRLSLAFPNVKQLVMTVLDKGQFDDYIKLPNLAGLGLMVPKTSNIDRAYVKRYFPLIRFLSQDNKLIKESEIIQSNIDKGTLKLV